MDEIVKEALRKWPNVPDVRGWLGLDARGRWFLRDERVRAAGPFPEVKGSLIEHGKLVDFIGRNYEADETGCWFFQNGPQRVYVELEAAPWVWRVQWLDNSALLTTHTGIEAQGVREALVDDDGRLFLDAPPRFGIVHSQDIHDAAQALEAGTWPAVRTLSFDEMPARFGYVLRPAREG
ncbi:MAG TPA: DUF2946 family protein [Burkholderiaceae bacterium]|nr:DUF2946 family protein [Burkholderiaceae bacterium]